MTSRQNFVGPDATRTRPPTPEKLAEMEAGASRESSAPLLDFDLSTLDGTRKATRPSAVMCWIRPAFFALLAVFSVPLTAALPGDPSLDLKPSSSS